MTTAEERMRILQMIAEGKISVGEGEKLLQTLHEGTGGESARSAAADKRWFRLRVTDATTGAARFSVNVPLSLVQVGLKMGARFVPEMHNVNVQEVIQRIREGAEGKILDAVNHESGERFEIYVE